MVVLCCCYVVVAAVFVNDSQLSQSGGWDLKSAPLKRCFIFHVGSDVHWCVPLGYTTHNKNSITFTTVHPWVKLARPGSVAFSDVLLQCRLFKEA